VNKSLYKIVENAIDDMDYQDLLASNAPKDEFEPEITKVCDTLKINDSVEDIAKLLTAIFNHSFNVDETPDMFINCATNIRIHLDDLIKNI
jgi:hypothetical protein